MSRSRRAAVKTSDALIAAAKIGADMEAAADRTGKTSTPKRKLPAKPSPQKTKTKQATKKPSVPTEAKRKSPVVKNTSLPAKPTTEKPRKLVDRVIDEHLLRKPSVSSKMVDKALKNILEAPDRRSPLTGVARQRWVKDNYPSIWVHENFIAYDLNEINFDRVLRSKPKFLTLEEALSSREATETMQEDRERRAERLERKRLEKEGEKAEDASVTIATESERSTVASGDTVTASATSTSKSQPPADPDVGEKEGQGS